MKNEEKAYLYWLHQVPGVGDKGMYRLMETCGSAREVYDASEKKLRAVLSQKQIDALQNLKKEWKVSEAYERMAEKKICLLSIADEEYPQRLRRMSRPPYILYVTGGLPKEATPTVAIIGARECSQYGEVMAKAFASCLVQAGVAVISGMARGIDGVSQEAAIASGGETFAVLGCGVDICYPACNHELYEAIKQNGGIISTYPPGTKPQKMLFPYRNQIVAGLADALLVVEARQKSGTWITVDRALEQGKEVYAVPGRLTDRLSDGCNLLIRQGAGITLSPEDLLAELDILRNRQIKKKEKDPGTENGKFEVTVQREKAQESGLMRGLDFYPKSVDEILEFVQKEDEEMTLPQLMFDLIQLCMQGKAEQVGGNYFVLKK